MGVLLTKGQNISLTKNSSGGSKSLAVGCGWDVNEAAGRSLFRRSSSQPYDLDLSAAGLDASGKVPHMQDPTDAGHQEWFIYANHRCPSNRSILFMGDNRTGEGEGDDEQITVDLELIPPIIERVVFAVVIWRADERGGQRFGRVKNAFIRVFDPATGDEIARYNLTDEFTNETLVMFGELYRHNGEWKFRAIGQGYDAVRYRQELAIAPPFEHEYARYRD